MRPSAQPAPVRGTAPLSSSRLSRGRACPGSAWRAQWRSAPCSPAHSQQAQLVEPECSAWHARLPPACCPSRQSACMSGRLHEASPPPGRPDEDRPCAAYRGHVVILQLAGVGHALPRVNQLQVIPLLQPREQSIPLASHCFIATQLDARASPARCGGAARATWMPGVLRTPSGLLARWMPPSNSARFTRSTVQSG